ncbi:MAG: type II secretion system protein [Methylococcales bacterium]|nr:type II secretion system protein [Methylococcales bacterium]
MRNTKATLHSGAMRADALTHGFSLLEMVVAFAIMGLALSMLLAIFSRNVRQAQIAEDYVNATQLAQSLLARVGHEWPLQDSDFSGVELERYHWRVLMQPDLLEQLPASLNARDVIPLRVMIRVQFGDDMTQPREVYLETLRLRS